MIRVQYKDLAPGLHGRAERRGRRTTIFLVPGLTSAQRRAALRRLRQEARRRCGPRLPVSQLAIALVADRVRVALRNTAAVIRLHPAGSILPTAAIGCLMVLFVLASVSVRIIGRPGVTGSGSIPMVSGPNAGASGPGASGKPSRALVVSSPGSGSGPVPPGVPTRAGASAGVGASAGGAMSTATSVGVSVSASAGPSPSRSQSAFSGGGDVSVCVNIGPLGGCVGL